MNTDNGFIGDCGYNQLLYPVDSETRKLLHWCVEKLPQKDEEEDEQDMRADVILNQRIVSALSKWSASHYLTGRIANAAKKHKKVSARSNVNSNAEVKARKALDDAKEKFKYVEDSVYWKAPFCRIKDSKCSAYRGDGVKAFRTAPSMGAICNVGSECHGKSLREPSLIATVLELHALELEKESGFALDLSLYDENKTSKTNTSSERLLNRVKGAINESFRKSQQYSWSSSSSKVSGISLHGLSHNDYLNVCSLDEQISSLSLSNSGVSSYYHFISHIKIIM